MINIDNFQTDNYYLHLDNSHFYENMTVYQIINKETGVCEHEFAMLPEAIANMANFQETLNQEIDNFNEWKRQNKPFSEHEPEDRPKVVKFNKDKEDE